MQEAFNTSANKSTANGQEHDDKHLARGSSQTTQLIQGLTSQSACRRRALLRGPSTDHIAAVMSNDQASGKRSISILMPMTYSPEAKF
jgi:hypothetical protein